jgi:hypothetical protein
LSKTTAPAELKLFRVYEELKATLVKHLLFKNGFADDSFVNTTICVSPSFGTIGNTVSVIFTLKY